MDQKTQRQSLIAFYFGPKVATSDPNSPEAIKLVAQRAYRDLNRTLTGFGTHPNREVLHQGVLDSINDFVQELKSVKSQGSFDKRHRAWCEDTCQTFASDKHPERVFNFHPGQAQKWLNMTLKYLAVLDHPQVQRVYEYLHVPIDKFVYEAASNEGIKRPLPDPESSTRSTAWSRLTYKQYWDYQQELRKFVSSSKKYATPLDWEADVWTSRHSEDSQKKGKAK